MDVLAKILSSAVRAEIFRVLFGPAGEELHMREIQRRTGFAIGTVQTELRKLLELDLVNKRRDGNRVYFSANQQNPLFNDIHKLVLKTTGLVDVLKKTLSVNEKVRLAFVFGSVARGEVQAGSDIDLMIIGDVGLREISRQLSGATDLIGREINPHVYTEEDFSSRKKSGEHFLNRLIEEPKLFIIGGEDDLEAVG
jgi:predicted nucleotidyltransferase